MLLNSNSFFTFFSSVAERYGLGIVFFYLILFIIVLLALISFFLLINSKFFSKIKIGRFEILNKDFTENISELVQIESRLFEEAREMFYRHNTWKYVDLIGDEMNMVESYVREIKLLFLEK